MVGEKKIKLKKAITVCFNKKKIKIYNKTATTTRGHLIIKNNSILKQF